MHNTRSFLECCDSIKKKNKTYNRIAYNIIRHYASPRGRNTSTHDRYTSVTSNHDHSATTTTTTTSNNDNNNNDDSNNNNNTSNNTYNN